mmetsp:Transcript_10367/g.29618  ORF Transcript_10367/g.29618 Transcript_10367/m.29618 type:complete len:224 (+) Transcript_10367:278-949(+)
MERMSMNARRSPGRKMTSVWQPPSCPLLLLSRGGRFSTLGEPSGPQRTEAHADLTCPGCPGIKSNDTSSMPWSSSTPGSGARADKSTRTLPSSEQSPPPSAGSPRCCTRIMRCRRRVDSLPSPAPSRNSIDLTCIPAGSAAALLVMNSDVHGASRTGLSSGTASTTGDLVLLNAARLSLRGSSEDTSRIWCSNVAAERSTRASLRPFSSSKRRDLWSMNSTPF